MLGRKILVADDEDHVLRVVAFKLRGAGYRVQTAVCGQEALAAVEIDRPDLIITDLQMPGMSGLELCEALVLSDRGTGIPVILLTARGHDLPIEGVQPSNLKRIMSKPFSPRQLVAGVKELLEEVAA